MGLIIADISANVSWARLLGKFAHLNFSFFYFVNVIVLIRTSTYPALINKVNITTFLSVA